MLADDGTVHILTDNIQQYIIELFSNYVDPGLKFVRKSCSQGIDQVGINVISSCTGNAVRLTLLKWLQSVVC